MAFVQIPPEPPGVLVDTDRLRRPPDLPAIPSSDRLETLGERPGLGMGVVPEEG
jgi:hypothetical protein